MPILIRRIAELAVPGSFVEVPRPIRIKRQQLLKERELERYVELAARQAGSNGRILVLLDADADCPAQLGPEILRRATAARSDRVIRVVVAKREYEAWFLAAAESLAGQRGISVTATAPVDPEAIANAKQWLSDHMQTGHSYRETLDQPALTSMLDLECARRASSFEKMWRDVASLL